MGRFRPDQYDPRPESSQVAPGIESGVDTKNTLVITTIDNKRNDKRSLCLCGCLGVPTGREAKFLMGHDARLKGMLIRAHLTGTPVARCVRDLEGKWHVTTGTALEFAKVLGWDAHLRTAESNFKNQAPKRSKAKAKVGETRRIKVGRWEYDAKITSVDGDSATFTYTSKSGETKTTTKVI